MPDVLCGIRRHTGSHHANVCGHRSVGPDSWRQGNGDGEVEYFLWGNPGSVPEWDSLVLSGGDMHIEVDRLIRREEGPHARRVGAFLRYQCDQYWHQTRHERNEEEAQECRV